MLRPLAQQTAPDGPTQGADLKLEPGHEPIAKPQPAWRRLLSLVLRVGGLAGSVWLLSVTVDFEDIGELLAQLPVWVALSLYALTLLRTYLTGLRWSWLCPPAAGLGALACTRLMLIGAALGLLLPSVVGSDLGRSVFVLREAKAEKGGALLSMVADRVVGLVSVLLFGLAGCLLTPVLVDRHLYAGLFTLALLGVLAVAWVGLHTGLQQRVLAWATSGGRLGQLALPWMRSAFDALNAYRERPRMALAALLLCVPIHVLSFSIGWFGALALGISIGWMTLAAVIAIIWVVTMLPISFGGLGLRELGFVFLLTGSGITAAQASAVAVVLSGLVVATAVTGVPLMWLGRGGGTTEAAGRSTTV